MYQRLIRRTARALSTSSPWPSFGSSVALDYMTLPGSVQPSVLSAQHLRGTLVGVRRGICEGFHENSGSTLNITQHPVCPTPCQSQEEVVELPSVLVSSPSWLLRGRPGCDVKAVVGILTIATPSPPPKHGHLVGNMRSPESLPEPTLPGLASPEPPGALHALFLATGGAGGLLVTLRLALPRPGGAGRCIWHRHHLLAVRALPGSGPKYVSGCSWRRPWTPDHHLFVLASSAEEEGWACGAPGAWGSLSL